MSLTSSSRPTHRRPAPSSRCWRPRGQPAPRESAQLAPPALAAPGATLVTGTLLGSDGRPMRAADMRIFRPQGNPVMLATARVDSLGRFAVATTARGTVVLCLSGVNHQSVLAWLQLGGPSPTAASDVAPVVLAACLARVPLADSRGPADTVKLRADAPDFGSPRAMTRGAAGCG